MAEKFERSGKFQIVFLVDVHVNKQIIRGDLEDIYNLKCRVISHCALRLLLYLNSRTYDSGSLKWGFKFYNSNVFNYDYKRRRFYELNCKSFELFEEEMRIRFRNASKAQNLGKTTATACLNCSLTEILHDFPWLTPDISSPSRSVKNDQFLDQGERSRNYLFVIGDSPLSNDDLSTFLGKSETFDAEVVFKKIFSTALQEEFSNKCGLSLYWIDSGLWCVAPEKLRISVKDWEGYKLISSLTKQLHGNIIPISHLVKDNGKISCPNLESVTLSSKGFKQTSKMLAKVQVMASMFNLSLGNIIETFLCGKDLINESIIDDAKLTPNNDGLLKGVLCFQEKKFCSMILSHVLQKKLVTITSPDDNNDHTMIKTPKSCNADLPNMNKETINPKDNLCRTTDQRTKQALNSKLSKHINCSTTPADSMINTKIGELSLENCFVIKGVMANTEISPSWMHPTKLFSCFSGETPDGLENKSTKLVDVFQQMLALISSKSLSMVLEYQDPSDGTYVTGILQPITPLCAILSMVNQDKLLLVEKTLLRHKSHGFTLVSNDLTLENGDPKMLPFSLQEHKEDYVNEKMMNENDENNCKLFKQKDNSSGKNIIDSYISCFKKKRVKGSKLAEKNLYVKLKDYYSKKKSQSNDEKTAGAAALTRGRQIQETSQKNKTKKLSESDAQDKILEDKMQDTTQSNLNSEQTDAMDEDFPDLSVVQTVDDLKINLKEGYKKCISQEQTISVYVTRTFKMIEQFKHTGLLKEPDDVVSLLKSTVLHDSKDLGKSFDAEEIESNKENIVLEHKLQVFLRLEFADKIGVDDEEDFADEITSILRAISFQKDPAYLSTFLKKTIIPRYSSNLSSLLRQIYDGLMQRPPKEILSPSQVTSEEETPLKSRKPLSSSKKVKSIEEAHSETSQSSRALVRRHSVMGVPAKRREIVVPVKGKVEKTRKKASSTGKRSGKKGASTLKKPVTPVKKVRRNLFEGNGRKPSPKKHSKGGSLKSERRTISRRHSIAAFNKSKKVADTPVGKQVSQRMLRRQEWERRRSKTVTDVTVVEESPEKEDGVLPRKSPRLKAAKFYSASQRATSIAKTEKINNSTSAECSDKNGANSVSDNSRSLHRAKSINTDHASSPRAKYTKLLNIKGTSSRKFDQEDSFAEVFLETSDKNERNILTVCTSEKQGDIVTCKNESEGGRETSNVPNLSLSTSKNPARKRSLSSMTPDKPLTSSLSKKCRSVSQRSHSSPSLSTTPPLKPSKSPLINHRSFPTTSPVLFRTPKTTPKSSPVNFSPDQIFDIAIPLTPVKGTFVKLIKTDSGKKKKLKCSPRSSEGVGAPSDVDGRDSEEAEIVSKCVGNNSESVVAASPTQNRKQSNKKSLGVKTSLNFKNGDSSRTREMDYDVISNDITEKEAKFPTVSTPEIQRPGQDNEVEDSRNTDVGPEQTEVFKSPVMRKRKKIGSGRKGNVSPLNQILKQRKNNRNTPPGTPRDEGNKLDKTENFSSSEGENKMKRSSLHKTRKRKKALYEDNYSQTEEKIQVDKSRRNISDDDQSPPHTNINSPSTQAQRNTKLVSSPSNLKPHFTPSCLSAGSLRHLQESPVLLNSGPTSSRARKWSERKSPFNTSRKRLRHDS